MRALFLASFAATTLFVAASTQAQVPPPPPPAPAFPAANYAAIYTDFVGNSTITVSAGFKTLDAFIQGLKDASSRISPSFDLLIRGIPATLGTDGPTLLILDIP